MCLVAARKYVTSRQGFTVCDTVLVLVNRLSLPVHALTRPCRPRPASRLRLPPYA